MQPNIIFILVDDLGWRDLSCYGSAFYETPELDRLAKAGMRFTDAYASSPVCSPTRASVLTGKYPATVGITDWISHGSFHPLRGRLVDVPYLKHLPASEQTIADALRQSGYRTWHVGKWHLGEKGHFPQDFGFEVNIGGSEKGSPGMGGYFSPWTLPGLENRGVPDGTELTDFLTDCALELIHRHPGDRPFFLNLWHYAVHTPIEAKLHLVQKYREKARDQGLDLQPTFEEGEYFPTENMRHERVRRRRSQSDPNYAAMLEGLDSNIGRLLRGLEEAGQRENTLIVFTSDNGGLATAESSPTSNLPLADGKGWMYEGGTRVPLIVSWTSKIPEGSVSDVPVISTDFYPTFLEVGGLPLRPGQHRDGVSLAGLLQSEHPPERDAIFWHYPHYGNQGGTPGSSIRMGDYKLLEFFEDNHIELYCLRDDPGEQENLVTEKGDLARLLLARLQAWRQSIEARIPEANPGWSVEASS